MKTPPAFKNNSAQGEPVFNGSYTQQTGKLNESNNTDATPQQPGDAEAEDKKDKPAEKEQLGS